MTRTSYNVEYKANLVLKVLQGEREFNQIADENSINANMLRNLKKKFLNNTGGVFDENKHNRTYIII